MYILITVYIKTNETKLKGTQVWICTDMKRKRQMRERPYKKEFYKDSESRNGENPE